MISLCVIWPAGEKLFCKMARYPGIPRIPLVFVTQIKIPSALLHPDFFLLTGRTRRVEILPKFRDFDNSY